MAGFYIMCSQVATADAGRDLLQHRAWLAVMNKTHHVHPRHIVLQKKRSVNYGKQM